MEVGSHKEGGRQVGTKRPSPIAAFELIYSAKIVIELARERGGFETRAILHVPGLWPGEMKETAYKMIIIETKS